MLLLAQLNNNAEVISIPAGTYINIKGNLNNNAGVIENAGTISLIGNYSNNATFYSVNNSIVKLEGSIQQIGGANPTTFSTLVIDGANNKQININTFISQSLLFNNNKIIIGNNNLTLLPSSSISGADNNRFVVTNGTGFLKIKELSIGIDNIFPVGNDVNLQNYKPVVLNYSGTVDTFSVRVEPGPSPIVGFSLPECVQYTYIVQDEIQGGKTGTLTLGWNNNSTDEGSGFNETQAKMWQFNGGSWNYLPGTLGALVGSYGSDREYTTQNSVITDFSGYKSRFLIKDPEDSDPLVPDAFSPNGDGQNDVLYVKGTGIKDIYFAVYNRWGEKVFETQDIQQGWDGTFKGSKLSNAVFDYYIKATYYSGKVVEKKGNVTLVR